MVRYTLRSESNVDMQSLLECTRKKALTLASEHGLSCEIQSEDIFDATVNHADAVSIINTALRDEQVITTQEPFRWSEDFGQFTAKYCGALFGLGAGENTPALHNPDYDFPDALIEIGSRYFIKITEHCLNLK